MTGPLSSQRTERILVQAMEEVLGEQGLRSVLSTAYPLPDGRAGATERLSGTPWPERQPLANGSIQASPVCMSRLMTAFEEVYGSLAGRGLALRVGRAAFSYSLREYGPDLGLTGAAFRLLPLPSKLRTFGRALADLFNGPGEKRLEVEGQDGKLLVHLLRCPLCSERHGSDAVCQLAVGLAEESLYWLSGGKIFQVEEISCAARGDADCTLQIDEAPIS